MSCALCSENSFGFFLKCAMGNLFMSVEHQKFYLIVKMPVLLKNSILFSIFSFSFQLNKIKKHKYLFDS